MTTTSDAGRQPASPRPPGGLDQLGKPVPEVRGDFTWVYLWGAPLRVMHWLAAVCIVALIISGLYIGRPYFSSGGEASDHYLMGRFRFVHFLSAAVIVMTGLVRAYWLVAGNKFERWPALFPFTWRSFRNMARMMQSYVRIHPEEQPHFVGHNPMAQWSYTGIYALTSVMVVTGFALYGQSAPEGFFFTAFAWVPALLGGLQHVRLVHHALTWAFPIFIVIHVYLAARADYIERAGLISSIITGGRFVGSHEKFEDFEHDLGHAAKWPEE